MRRLGWVIWFGVWAAVAIPWGSFDLTAHPGRIVWLTPVPPRDALLNLAFYVPFGALGAWSGWGTGRVLGVAAGVSLLTEVLQVFAAGRWPATSDVVMNLAGAAIGWYGVGWYGVRPPSQGDSTP